MSRPKRKPKVRKANGDPERRIRKASKRINKLMAFVKRKKAQQQERLRRKQRTQRRRER